MGILRTTAIRGSRKEEDTRPGEERRRGGGAVCIFVSVDPMDFEERAARGAMLPPDAARWCCGDGGREAESYGGGLEKERERVWSI